jgi:hypothetical protein
MPTPKEVLARGAAWTPYASFAAWYLWRSLELPETAEARRRLLARDAAKRRKENAAPPKRASAKRAKSKRGRKPRRVTAAKHGTSRRSTAKRAAVKRAAVKRAAPKRR